MIARRNKTCGGKIIGDLCSYIFSGRKNKTDYVGVFEKQLAAFLDAKYVLLTPTGRKGLSLILEYYRFPKGAQIILPAYTLKDLVFMIQEKGYAPVFVDIDPYTYNMDASLVAAKITDKTVMVIATHLFGMPCEIDKIVEICKGQGVVVIEDCAHSLGARFKGKRVGAFADAAFFSFEVSKPVNTFGGGAVATDNEGLANFIRKEIKEYPQPKKELFVKISTSIMEDLVVHSFLFFVLAYLFYFRWTKILTTRLYLFFSRKVNIKDFAYTNLQAYLGLMQLKDLDIRNKILMNKLFKMRQYFSGEVKYQQNPFGAQEAFYYNIVLTDKNCDELRKRLLYRNVDVGVKDEITDNCIMCFEPDKISLYPAIEKCYTKLIQLPLSYNMDESALKKVALRLNKCLS